MSAAPTASSAAPLLTAGIHCRVDSGQEPRTLRVVVQHRSIHSQNPEPWSAPGSAQAATPRPRLPSAVRVFLIISIVVFAFAEWVPGMREPVHRWLALWFPGHPNFGVWQLLTSVFMHATVAHIALNMLGLVTFGSPLEQGWGTRRFVVFYIVCGIGAALTHLGAQEVRFHLLWRHLSEAGVPGSALAPLLRMNAVSVFMPTAEAREAATALARIYHGSMVGASGALYGILVAFAMIYPRVRLTLIFLPVPIEVRFFIPGLLLLDLFSGVTGFSIFGGGIAHFAHLGGALIGLLLMLLWRRRAPS